MSNAKKQKLFGLVDERSEELIQLCADLIKIPSVTPEQNEAILEFVCAWLSDCGIKYEVVRSANNTPSIVFNVGNPQGDLVVMDGHNDVVSAGDYEKWDFSPFCGTITDSLILGRGTSDMKCGTAIILIIAKWIAEGLLDFKGNLRGFIVHDEESGGENGSLHLIEEGYADGTKYCLVPEPTSYNNIEVGQKGSMRINFKATNAEGADKAANTMIKLLYPLRDLSNLTSDLSDDYKEVYDNSVEIITKAFNNTPGVENAIDHVNVRTNKIWMEDDGESCCMQLAFTLPVFVTTDQIKQGIEKIIKDLGVTNVTYKYARSKESAHTETDTELVKSAVTNAEAVTGKRVIPAWQWATSDCKFFRYKGIPAIQYGPARTEGIHSYNECVDIEEIINTCKTYLGILEDLTGFNA